MSAPLFATVLWVLAGVIVAMLPIRRQYFPGAALLLSGFALIFWIGAVHGWPAGVAVLLAYLSMMRNPLRFLWRELRGENPQLPE